MTAFAYVARTTQGKTKKGLVDAATEGDARLILRKMQLMPVTVKQKKTDILAKVELFQPRIKGKDVVIMTRQFSTMIDAGLPVVQCLEILGDQQDKKNFKKTIQTIREDVEGGSTLTEALAKFPKVFSSLYSSLVAAGEAGGVLDTILNRLASYMEKMMALKSKIKGAMVYPAVIVAVAILVMSVIMIFVIPVFAKMYGSMGAALPLPTQMVVNLSYFVKNNVLFVAMGIGVLIFLLRYFYKTDGGERIIDSLVLKAPVFGPLIRKVAVAKFTRTLSTMLASGVPILEGLDIVASTAGNRTVESAIRKSKKAISEGKTIAEPLAESGVFPSMVLQMISVGEATGELDAMLSKIADFYDEEVDNAVNTLTSLIEPLMMVFLGGAIGGLVIAMYLPIFQMAAVLAGH